VDHARLHRLGHPVLSASGRRTQVEAIDDLTAQLRLANHIAVLALGASALENDSTEYKNPATQVRADRRNAVRAVVRAGIETEETKA